MNNKDTILSSFNDWDNAIGGFAPGQFIILAARPAMGKTAFLLSLIKKITVMQNIPTALFTLEMSNVQMVRKLLANVFNSDINGFVMTLPKDEQEDMEIVVQRVLKDTPLNLDEIPSLTFEDIQNKITDLKNKGVKIAFIDYIQLINGFSKDIDLTVASLKRLAEENQITLIATSQMRKCDNIILSDGSLNSEEADKVIDDAYKKYADIVAVIHRPEYYIIPEWGTENNHKNIAEIYFIKNTASDVKMIQMKFYCNMAKFTNLPQDNNN